MLDCWRGHIPISHLASSIWHLLLGRNSVTFDESKWMWMNGRAIPWHNATTHVSAHGLHCGSGIFEGMRCYETDDGPAVFRLDAHLDRLYASAEIYGITIPFTREELASGVDEIVSLNNFRSC